MKKAFLPEQSRYTRKLKLIKGDEYNEPQLELHGWYFSMENEFNQELVGVDNDEEKFVNDYLAIYNATEAEYEKNGWGTPILHCYAYPTINGNFVEESEPGHPYHIINPREDYIFSY